MVSLAPWSMPMGSGIIGSTEIRTGGLQAPGAVANGGHTSGRGAA